MTFRGCRLAYAFFSFAWVGAAGQNIDSVVRQRVLAGETPGIVVGVYAKGHISYYTEGFADVAARKTVTPRTLFEIGSITKTFTTLIAARMVENGQWSLDDPAQKFLPQGRHIPEKSGHLITLENLATARSGLPRMPDNFSPSDPANPFLDYTGKKMFEFLDGYKMTREPGASYEYSNLGMGLLGYLAAERNHMTYRQLVEEWITRPLHMDRTFVNTSAQQVPDFATGHAGNVAVKSWTWSDESALTGAGGLVSDAEDMMTYLIANLRNSSPLGSAMAMTHKPRHDAGSLRMQIGLGWHVLNNKIIWHNGGTGGFRTFAGFNPETNSAVVVLTNSTTGADDLGFFLLDHSLPLKNIHVLAIVEEKVLKQYVGEYEITPAFKLVVSLEGSSLFVQATGQNKFGLLPESQTKFFINEPRAQIEFVTNAAGAVEKLLLRQDGAVHTALKTK